jgi:hypothetical protein
MKVRCDTCGGRKKVLGMGGMIKVCEDCKGGGWRDEVTLCAPSEEVKLDKRSKEYRELKKQQLRC